MLYLIVFAILTQFQPPISCEIAYFYRHDAIDHVFETFPDRQDDSVVNYMASVDCAEIGEDRYVLAGNKFWRFRVVDCLARKQKPKPYYGGDLDARFWFGHHIPNKAFKTVICNENPIFAVRQREMFWRDFLLLK